MNDKPVPRPIAWTILALLLISVTVCLLAPLPPAKARASRAYSVNRIAHPYPKTSFTMVTNPDTTKRDATR